MKILRRVVLGFAIAVALLLLLIAGIGWYIAPRDKLVKSDAIVVVSGGDTATRTAEGIRLWKENWAPTLVFSGAAADQGTSNAAVMRQQAIMAGVPPSAIITEGSSTNTRQNAEFLKPILASRDDRRIILVSSPYHTRRVKVNFQKVFGPNYQFIAAPAKDSQWARSSWWQQPETISLTGDELSKTIYATFFQK